MNLELPENIIKNLNLQFLLVKFTFCELFCIFAYLMRIHLIKKQL